LPGENQNISHILSLETKISESCPLVRLLARLLALFPTQKGIAVAARKVQLGKEFRGVN
jgi:hypothetical protein